MALVVTRQEVQAIPVDVSTIISPVNTDRLGFNIECQEVNCDWWVTFDALAAADGTGIYNSGRVVLGSTLTIPAQGNTTLHFGGAVNVFVKASAGRATVDFWVIEIEAT